MNKVFIYYSLTGNGDYVANILKEKGIEIRKVVTNLKMPHSFLGKILKGGFLAGINYHAKLIDFNNNIDNFKDIIIGTPIWNGKISCPVNSVLDSLNLQNKKITFILYSGSGKALKLENKLKERYSDCKIINLQNPLENKINDIKI